MMCLPLHILARASQLLLLLLRPASAHAVQMAPREVIAKPCQARAQLRCCARGILHASS